ncbi:cytochrome P450 [Pseudonocardia lacus]|uniref:cytochrome P450 n=1 Tax=Pseudonocardia lacus TaxID=2835865 RepID=UPI001BDC2992|nr:cytochrome P450 [Pseudonocardia lacus]
MPTTEQARPPLLRTTSPAGDPAWLVTDYDTLRTLLTDRRLTRSHPDPERAPRFSESLLLGRPLQATPTDAADHARMRKLLLPRFGARPMRAMRARVEHLVDGLLDDLARRTPPVDFHEAISFPLPALVICELLGVPYAERDEFRRWSRDAGDMLDQDRSAAALGRLWQYLHGLVSARLDEPGDDVLSALAAEHRADPEGFTLDEATRLGAGLLFAGHETTVTSIDSGVALLSLHPEQRDALVADPSLVEGAVEEILRMRPHPFPRPAEEGTDGTAFGPARWATADIEVGATTIRRGDLVVLGLHLANAGPRVVGDQPGFDVRRHPNPHLSFGHGLRLCVGAPLARMELQVLFARLLPRFPGLRLAVPVERLRVQADVLTGGVAELPVTW